MNSTEEDDARTVAAARDAAYFMVTIYVSQGTMCRLPAKSLAHARAGGALLEQRLNNGRLSMVYAIADDESTGIFVSRRLDERILSAQPPSS